MCPCSGPWSKNAHVIAGLTISGFADEISTDFDEQLRTVTELGMNHICLRAADGKGIAAYSLGQAETLLLPRLDTAGVRVSSLGSPIGKIDIADDAAFERQLMQLETLCRMCDLFDCDYIRVFSFYVPTDRPVDEWSETVVGKLRQFVDIAQRYDVTLIHENEKGIFGDTSARCRQLFDALAGAPFKAAFDFANFVQCGENPETCWQSLSNDVVYFHIKDARFDAERNVLCGRGDGRVPEILSQAVNAGYHGFLTLEPHLADFSTFASLERESSPAKQPARLDGPSAYAAQYHALLDILRTIEETGPR